MTELFENALNQLQICANEMGLNQDVHEFLKIPMHELHVSIPVKMDNGSTKTFQGFRVQYNNALGPYKGGIRFHPDETIETVKGLAIIMTWKVALLGLPLGGGKGGVICDTKKMSQGELERLSRGYIRAIYKSIGPNVDSMAPDVYTNPQIMAYMMDEYLALTDENGKGVLTGKPIEIGGSQGRGDATARGGMYCLREALWQIDVGHNNINDDYNTDHVFTVAIQGYGNAGQHAHRLIEEMFPAAKVIAVSDSQGGVYDERGLRYEAAKEVKERTGTVKSNSSHFISNEELLQLDVDVLIPAALESVIVDDEYGSNADKIKAKIILELSNGPVTPEADKILFANGVHVIPDFLANAGGVVVSWMEMVQNSQNYFWPEEEVYQKLDTRMTEAYHKVFDVGERGSIDMRTAAYILAVGRVAEAMKLRGWV